MSIKVTVRSLGGEASVELEDGATAKEVRKAAKVAAGAVLRGDGQRIDDDAEVRDGQTLVATPPDAKHGHE